MTLVITDGEFWWSWRPCNTSFNALIIKCINGLYFTLRCNKGIKKVLWLKISHILNVMIAVRS